MFKLTNQNIVVLGSFNPAILQPAWLIKCGIIKEEKEVNWKLPLGAVIAPAIFEYGNLEWAVNFDKFQLSDKTDDGMVDLGKTVIHTFKELKHTPVRASGHNFIFKGTDKVLAGSLFEEGSLDTGEKFFNLGTVQNVTKEIKISLDERKFLNLKTVKNDKHFEVSFNFHFDAGSMDEALAHCLSYPGNYNQALNILNRLGEE